MRIGIFYGSSMGNTEELAQSIYDSMSHLAEPPQEVHQCAPEDLTGYEVLLLGIPTWHIGEMQDDWVEFAPKVAQLDLKGVRVALFGCGDQAGYPTTFGDALGLLWEHVQRTGAQLIGQTATNGYTFETSKSIDAQGRFLGLLVDNDNESDQTTKRTSMWIDQVLQEIQAEAEQT